jgi:hypothetical protein
VSVPDQTRKEIDAKSHACILLSTLPHGNYRLLDPLTRRVHVSSHVVFNEHVFPARKDTPTALTPPTVVHPAYTAADVHAAPALSVTFDDSVMPEGGDGSAAVLPADISNANNDSAQGGEDVEVQKAAGEIEDQEEADSSENTAETNTPADAKDAETNAPEDKYEADAPEEQAGEPQVVESRYPRRERRFPAW